MTLKTNLVAWRVTGPGVFKSLYDGSTAAFTPPTSGSSTLWGAYVEPHTAAMTGGAAETLAQANTRFNTAIGATCQCYRVYDSNGGPNKVLTAMQGIGLGTTPMIPSFKLDPNAVAAGTYDATITAFFQAMPTTINTYWSYYHEFDAKIAKGTFTYAQWQPAWVRCKQLADAVGNPHLKATVIYTGFNFTGPSGRLAAYQPGISGYVDVVAVDPYQLLSAPSQSAQALCEPLYNEVVALGGPKFGVAEIASKNRGTGLTYVDNFVQSLWWLDGKAEFVTWFNAYSDAAGDNDEIDDIPVAAGYYGQHVRHLG